MYRQRLSRYLTLPAVAGLLWACTSTPQPVQPSFGGQWLIDGGLQGSPGIKVGTIHQQSDHAKPQLALVLGGGGMRGFAHIGVLQALEEAGIHPDLVVGTSIGSIIGAAYASGISPDRLWQEANTLRVRSLADLAFHGPGFVKGDALSHWAEKLVGKQAIEHFPVRFAAVATDLESSRPYVITQGHAGQALRASAAIPGVFLPVQANGVTLVDGGVTALVPVQAARALGADVVVAVDIYCQGPQYPSNSAISMVLRVSQAQSCLLSSPEAASADILIAPSITPPGTEDTEGREVARWQGHEATIKQLPALRTALKQHGFTTPPELLAAKVVEPRSP